MDWHRGHVLLPDFDRFDNRGLPPLRRWTFPILAGFFFFYSFLGQIFPASWAHKNFTFDAVFQNLYHTTNGIWGQMVGLSAGMLAMFGIFCAVLSKTGGSQTFIKFAQKLTGKPSAVPVRSH